MTENPANTGEADGTYRSTLVAFGPQDEQADLPDELADAEDELDVPAGLAGTDDHDQGGGGGFAAGAVSGGFGFAGLALAVVSLTTNWTGGVVASHSQYGTEMNAPSSGLTAQQQLNMYANAWHTQGWWALVFAAAAVLAGAGALLWPRFRRRPRLGQGRRDQCDHRGSGRRAARGPHHCRGVRRAPDRPRQRDLRGARRISD
jgi:hypothetical protein